MILSTLKQSIIFLLLLTSTCSFSANWELSDCHLEKASEFIGGKKTDSAVVYFNKAMELRLPIYQTEKNWRGAIEDYTLIGKKLRSFDSEQALYFLQQAIGVGTKYLTDKESSLFKAYYYHGLIYRDMGKNDLAKDVLEKAIDLQLLRAPKSKEMAGACKVLATVFAARANYPKAFIYFDEAIAIYKTLKDTARLSKVYYDKATTFRLDKQYNQAIYYLDLAVQFSNLSRRDKSIICREKGRCLLALEESEKAIQNIQKALNIAKEIEDARLITYTSKILGHAYAQQKNFDMALSNYSKALQLTSIEYPRERANIHQRIGTVYHQIFQTDSALYHFQKSLTLLFDDFQNEDIHSNPPAKNIYQDPFLLLILEGKANSFQQRYQQTNDTQDLKLALESFQLALSSMNLLVQNYENEAAQFFLRSNKYNLFQEALKATYQLHLLYPKNPIYLQQAFNISEKSKAFSLLQKLRKTEAQQLVELPDSLVQKIQKLQQKEEQLKWYVANTTNQPYKDSLFQLQREKEQLTAYTENTYPDYRKIRHKQEIASLQKLQEYLNTGSSSGKNKALLEYFVGDSTIYTFLITSNDIQVQSIPNTTAFKEQVNNFQMSIVDTVFHNARKVFDTYTKSALAIHNHLLSNSFDTISFSKIEELYIIPDDYLYKIPFEALLSKAPDKDQDNDMRYKTLDYLLNKHTISYGYSATLLLESLQKRKQIPQYRGNLLGFAPNFRGNQGSTRGFDGGNLPDLKGGEKEVEEISKIVGGRIYLREAAHKEAFLNEARYYRILHLSTHAYADEANYETNLIYFAKSYLVNRELSSLRLQADLAVLSACLSGRGFLQKGEGVMSLARAFLYAGCPSVISSLWSVDDEKTSELMRGFYTNLKARQTKSSALQNAKLSFLDNQNNEEAHPFYWAAFVHIGNPNPIILEGNYDAFWKIFTLILGLTMVLFLVIKKKR